jgi:hypothetical protein
MESIIDGKSREQLTSICSPSKKYVTCPSKHINVYDSHSSWLRV